MIRPVSDHSGNLGGYYEMDERSRSSSASIATDAMSRYSVESSFFSVDDEDKTTDDNEDNNTEYNISKDKYGNLRGFLHKKTRDGRWQKRFFEMNGVYLTYYKNEKMEKILAALSLLKVGDIRYIGSGEDLKSDGNENKNSNKNNMNITQGVFSLQLDGCDYFIRADSQRRAMQWIDALKKVQAANTGALNKIKKITKNPMQNGGGGSNSPGPSPKNESLGKWSKSENSVFSSIFCCCAK